MLSLARLLLECSARQAGAGYLPGDLRVMWLDRMWDKIGLDIASPLVRGYESGSVEWTLTRTGVGLAGHVARRSPQTHRVTEVAAVLGGGKAAALDLEVDR